MTNFATNVQMLCSMQRILDSLTVMMRWWKQLDYLEVEWTAGPIDIADGLGKELVLQYQTNLSTGSTFYTDANGRELQKRVLDYRPTWDLKVEEPVSGNYYPLTAAIAVKVGVPIRLHLLSKVSQSCTSSPAWRTLNMVQ